MTSEYVHFKNALVRARRAVTGDLIPHKSLELVNSQTTGSLKSGRLQHRDILIGAQVVEIRTRTKTEAAG